MKKIIFLIISLVLIPINVYATSGKITVSSQGKVVLGNKVTVTVKISTGSSWQVDLSYDKNYLQLVGGGGESGGTYMVNTSTGKPNRTYTFTFKTLKTGNTTVKIGSYYVVDDSFNTVSISPSNKTISIITQAELEASYSKDNNLKSLAVEGFTITPEFNKDTLEYQVDVPEDTKTVSITATPNDSRSSISGTGTIELTEGTNNVDVVVKAENGSEKTYKLTINVIDKNPINVKVDNVDYTVVKIRSNYSCPALYAEKNITIDEYTIPACFNEDINYTLVGLKNSEGKVDSFVYDNGNYTKYNELTGTSLKIIPLEYSSKLIGYTKEEITINDIKYNAFKNDKSKLYIIYGINLEDGKKDFYTYDEKNKTFSSYDKEFVDSLIKKNNTYVYVIIAFAVALFASLTGLLILSKNKNKKVVKEEIKEEIKEEENIIEEKKKTRRKKKKEEIEEE